MEDKRSLMHWYEQVMGDEQIKGIATNKVKLSASLLHSSITAELVDELKDLNETLRKMEYQSSVIAEELHYIRTKPARMRTLWQFIKDLFITKHYSNGRT